MAFDDTAALVEAKTPEDCPRNDLRRLMLSSTSPPIVASDAEGCVTPKPPRAPNLAPSS